MRKTYMVSFNLGRQGEPTPQIAAVLPLIKEWCSKRRVGIETNVVKAVDVGKVGETEIGQDCSITVMQHVEPKAHYYALRLEHPNRPQVGSLAHQYLPIQRQWGSDGLC